MTYTFFSPSHGKYIIYDTASGAVIKTGELEAYICDALDPCGESIVLRDKCPSEIRYELARYASSEVDAAYQNVREYYNKGYIYGISEKFNLIESGELSADSDLIAMILAETGLPKDKICFI